MRFGWRVARAYLDSTASSALAPGSDVADVVMVAEVMALAFAEVSGVLVAKSRLGQEHPKGWIPVVARQDLAELRAELSPSAQTYFADNASDIREWFAEEFGHAYPSFARIYNGVRGRPEEEPVGLWDVMARHLKTQPRFTVGQLFDQVLRPVADEERLAQDAIDVMRADSAGLDRRGDRGQGLLPLVVVELRASYGPLAGMVDRPLMVEGVGEVAGMARKGEAAAEFTRRLAASLEGQLVVAWLRQAAAVPEGAGRDRAVLMLRHAAGWYLAGFPGEAEALELALTLLGRGLRLRVTGGFAAANLPGAPPELPGQWAEATDRYEVAYGAVREAARGVALPSAALRALIGELAGLPGAGSEAGYRLEVLDDHVVLTLLADIGQSLPGRGGAELMALVNDLLMAASLRSAAAADVPGTGVVSAGRLVDVLWELSGAVAGGQDPWTAPVLAGTGYRADEPLAVRLTRLAQLTLLSSSPESQLVVAWLLQAAAAPGEDERERAAVRLRQAAEWYLARFPGEAGELTMMLGPVAEMLGVPGGFGAAALPGAPPELPGRWAEVAGRYELAYDVMRQVAPRVALPSAAVRALVGDLSELVQGRDVAAYLPEVLGDPEIRRLLASIGQGLPARDGAALVMVVNDLLVAASLVPEPQLVEIVSANRLVDLLRQISGALASGRDPLGVLAGTGYRADEPLGARLARLALLNLTEPARTRLADDPLFNELLGSALLDEALFAASGAEALFFVNTGVVAAVDQVLLARVPTIAGLLVAGRELVSWLEGQVAQLSAGVLELPDRSGPWRLHRARTVGELVRWRIERARAEFDAIASQARAVLALRDRGAAGEPLQALTRRWSEAMHKLAGVAAVGGDSGSPQVPVLTRRLVPDLPWLSRMLAAPLQVDRSGRRAAGVGLDDYLAPVNRLLSWPVLAPFRPLAGRLGSAAERARFWELVRGEGGILVRTGADADRRLLYLRAVRRGGDRVFAFSDPGQSTSQVRRLSQITGWARSEAAQVHDAYLPADRSAGITPPALEVAARRAAQAAGELREDLLSLLGGPPAAGGRFRALALQRLNGASDEELRELFGSDGALLEMVEVLSARIPRGDSLRGELDNVIGRLFLGSWRVPAAGTVEPAGPEVIATPSGYFVTESPAAADGGADLAAAMRFPAVVGAKVLHVQVDGTGNFLAGGRALGTGEFHEQVVRGLAQPPGQMLILVAHRGAQVPAVGQAAGALLASLGDRPVLAPNTDVFTTADGRVVTAAGSRLDAAGRLVMETATLGNWVLFTPAEQEVSLYRAGRAILGHDLLDVLLDEDFRLAASLPAEVAAPVVEAGAMAARFSEQSLRQLVIDLADGARRAMAREGSLAGCVEVVGGFLKRVYGRVRPAGAVDDGVTGLGGVAGVQQGLVPGPGWGRVGSWDELEGAVEEAGPGATAVVLVSSAGGGQGHALALHAVPGGRHWMDPARGGVVSVDRPPAVGPAVAAWAVVVRPDGRVLRVPGGWSGPESAGGDEVLVDAPVRHDFAAMGLESEAVREWLANRLPLGGVFDLVLEVDDSGLYHFHGGARELVDLGVLVRLLAERGASPDDVVRLVVPDGARFGELMTALANFRQRPVLVTPAGADLAVAPLSRADPQGLDIAPTSQARPEVPWQVIWPSQSWEYRARPRRWWRTTSGSVTRSWWGCASVRPG